MFDFFSNQLSELLNGTEPSELFSAESVLSAAGLDLADLSGLPVEEALSALASAGVDVSALTDGQLGELLATLNATGGSPAE
jgi:hypothetical protein